MTRIYLLYDSNIVSAFNLTCGDAYFALYLVFPSFKS